MCRAFTTEPVDADVVDMLIDAARRAPSAGNTQAMHFLVLEGSQVGEYWDITLPEERRAGFPWPDLPKAPTLIVPFVDAHAYVDRYAAGDKAHTGLGASPGAWSTPYWWVDGGMAAMTLLLGVEELGLGALFFGLFDHEDDVKRAFGVPMPLRAVGTVAIGHPAAQQRSSASARRPRPSLDDVIHRGRW